MIVKIVFSSGECECAQLNEELRINIYSWHPWWLNERWTHTTLLKWSNRKLHNIFWWRTREMSVRRTIDLSIPNDVQLLSHLCYDDFNKKGEPCKAGLNWSKATIQAIWQSKTDNLFEKVTDSFIEDVSLREAFVSGWSSRKEGLDSRSRWCRR